MFDPGRILKTCRQTHGNLLTSFGSKGTPCATHCQRHCKCKEMVWVDWQCTKFRTKMESEATNVAAVDV